MFGARKDLAATQPRHGPEHSRDYRCWLPSTRATRVPELFLLEPDMPLFSIPELPLFIEVELPLDMLDQLAAVLDR